MIAKRVDIRLTLDILNRYNDGEFDHFEKIIPDGIPPIDGIGVVDIRDKSPDSILFSFPKQKALANLERNGILPSNDTHHGKSALFEKRKVAKLLFFLRLEHLKKSACGFSDDVPMASSMAALQQAMPTLKKTGPSTKLYSRSSDHRSSVSRASAEICPKV